MYPAIANRRAISVGYCVAEVERPKIHFDCIPAVAVTRHCDDRSLHGDVQHQNHAYLRFALQPSIRGMRALGCVAMLRKLQTPFNRARECETVAWLLKANYWLSRERQRLQCKSTSYRDVRFALGWY